MDRETMHKLGIKSFFVDKSKAEIKIGASDSAIATIELENDYDDIRFNVHIKGDVSLSRSFFNTCDFTKNMFPAFAIDVWDLFLKYFYECIMEPHKDIVESIKIVDDPHVFHGKNITKEIEESFEKLRYLGYAQKRYSHCQDSHHPGYKLTEEGKKLKRLIDYLEKRKTVEGGK